MIDNEEVDAFFVEFSGSNFPPFCGTWHEENSYDPRYMRRTLAAAKAQKLIEIDKRDPKNWRFRLAPQAAERGEKIRQQHFEMLIIAVEAKAS